MSATPIAVLLVEDNGQEARLIAAMLTKAHPGTFVVEWTSTLSAALERLRAVKFDVVLLDLGLPDSQGIATVHHLRQAAPETPVVVLTGLDDEELGVEALRGGAQDYLVKGGLGPHALARAIRYTLERRRAEEALRAVAEERRAILQASPAPIIALDYAGRVTLWTPAAERLLGWSAQEVNLQPLPIFQGVDNEGLEERLRSVREGQTLTDAEVRVRRKDGSVVDVSLSAARLSDARGQCAGLIAVLVDLSERKRHETQIVEVMETEQLRLGRDLHDSLGQQLTGVQLTVAAIARRLAEKSLPEAAHAANAAKLLEAASRETRYLSRGLCPAIHLSGGLPKALQSLAQPITGAHGVECLCQCDTEVELDDRTSTDLYRIAQEAMNNAIRHAKAKTVILRLGARDGRLTLAVQDDGVGIPEGALARGMGISTMKHRARRMGGELEIRRGPQGGTIVTCSITYRGPKELQGETRAQAQRP